MSNKKSQTFIKEDCYTAGLIDGEGTITLSKSKNSFRFPTVSVSSTSHELLEFLKLTYGGYISNHKTYKAHHKKSWSWSLKRDSALYFLERISVYLKETSKKRRALFILKFYKKVTPRNGKYTEFQISKKQQFERIFFNL